MTYNEANKIPFDDKVKFLKDKGYEFFYDRNLYFCKKKSDSDNYFSIEFCFMNEKNKDAETLLKEQMQYGDISVLCNKCGCDTRVYETDCNKKPFFVGYYGLINGKVTGGYSSTHLKDTCIYKFSLCEKCLSEMFDSFKVPVSIENYI